MTPRRGETVVGLERLHRNVTLLCCGFPRYWELEIEEGQ